MPTIPDQPRSPPPASPLWFFIPASTIVLGIMLGLLSGGPDPASTLHGTSYDASSSGYRGVYLILEELGYPVAHSRRITAGSVRWLLTPAKPKTVDVTALSNWIGRGGKLLLADPKGEVAQALGLQVGCETVTPTSLPTSLDDVGELSAGTSLVEPTANDGTTWAFAAGEPLVTIHKVGQGEIWLLHRPDALDNEQMRNADNSVFAARLADAMLNRSAARLEFDEYCHGLRDRPGIIELLTQPPVRTATLQALLAVSLLLWASAVRFGPVRPMPAPRRRSKEEFLEALANLMTRQGDAASAFRTVQGDLLRKLAEQSGLPASAHPDTIIEVTARRRPMTPEYAQALSAAAPPGGLIAAIRQLDKASHELLRH